MRAASNDGQLYIPALKSEMGGWDYYIGQMRLSDVASIVAVAEEIHSSSSLNTLIQRAISKRAGQISDYLVHREDRLFNAFVIGVYGGEPQWYSLDVKSNPVFDADRLLPRRVESAIGFLVFSGKEKLFAIDGQHRVLGIRKALSSAPSLGNEQVAAIFVGHSNSPEGLIRTRRLFTALNKYAKPVSKRDRIALDEDDVVAIITRRLVEEHPLFSGEISSSSTNNISPSDNSNITTIGALYDSLDVWLRDRSAKAWRDFRKFRPNDETIQEYEQAALELWNIVCASMPAVQSFRDAIPRPGLASEHRSRKTGGHIVFRPIGLILVVKILKSLRNELSLAEAANRLAHLPVKLDEYPWEGVIWDARNRRMITESANKKVAEQLGYLGLFGDLKRIKSSATKLRMELAGIKNLAPDQVRLVTFIDESADPE